MLRVGGNIMNFANRVVIVTGGASGIGKEVAVQFAKNGASIVVVDANEAGAKIVADNLQGNAIAVSADVTNQKAVNAMVAEVIRQYGRLDILVHSAGIGLERSFLETSLEEWRRILDIDLTGTFLCCQAAAKEMSKQGYGRIVTLSSTAGIRGGTGRAAYGSAKGGVIALTKVMAIELASHGITVNALAPGAIETELVAEMHSPQTRTTYTKAIPANRYGTPAEVAVSALFLASESASYITGHVLGVDGGFLAAGVMHKND